MPNNQNHSTVQPRPTSEELDNILGTLCIQVLNWGKGRDIKQLCEVEVPRMAQEIRTLWAELEAFLAAVNYQIQLTDVCPLCEGWRASEGVHAEDCPMQDY